MNTYKIYFTDSSKNKSSVIVAAVSHGAAINKFFADNAAIGNDVNVDAVEKV